MSFPFCLSLLFSDPALPYFLELLTHSAVVGNQIKKKLEEITICTANSCIAAAQYMWFVLSTIQYIDDKAMHWNSLARATQLANKMERKERKVNQPYAEFKRLNGETELWRGNNGGDQIDIMTVMKIIVAERVYLYGNHGCWHGGGW